MPSTFSNYFSSKSKSQVLEILYYHSVPIHLRLIHQFSDLSVHAIDLAVKELLELKILKATEIEGKKKYSLNLKHKDFKLIDTVLRSLKEFQISSRTNSYTKKATATLNFIEDASKLVNVAKTKFKK